MVDVSVVVASAVVIDSAVVVGSVVAVALAVVVFKDIVGTMVGDLDDTDVVSVVVREGKQLGILDGFTVG